MWNIMYLGGDKDTGVHDDYIDHTTMHSLGLFFV